MIFYNPEDAERHGGQAIDRYYFDSINTRNCFARPLGRTHSAHPHAVERAVELR